MDFSELTSEQIDEVSGGMMNPIRGMIGAYRMAKEAWENHQRQWRIEDPDEIYV